MLALTVSARFSHSALLLYWLWKVANCSRAAASVWYSPWQRVISDAVATVVAVRSARVIEAMVLVFILSPNMNVVKLLIPLE